MKKGCTNYTKPPKKSQVVPEADDDEAEDSDKPSDAEDPEEDEADEVPVEESPTSSKSKGKGIIKALTSPFKRKQAERSPEAPSPPSPRKSRFTLVGVLMPPPPLPYSSYIQLGSRASAAPSTVSAPPPEPPRSSSPSLVSFESQGSGRGSHYEVERLRTLYNISQENLAYQQKLHQEELELSRRRQEERERRLQQQFDRERALYAAQIEELERANQASHWSNQASGSSSRGGSRRR